MEKLQELFNYYDSDNDGFIDVLAFKQIINILDLPLTDNIENKKYNYNDTCNYIHNNHKVKKIKKNRIKVILKKYMNETDSNFILNELFKNNNKTETDIDINKIKKYSNKILDQSNLQ